MKRNILFFVLIGLLTSSCIEERSLSYSVLSIKGQMSWSADLLEFVTPTFTFTDVMGFHEVEVTDDMITEKKMSYIEDGEEVCLGNIKICDFDLECVYNTEDTIYTTIMYDIKENIPIVLDTTYEFDHDLSVNRVSIGNNILTFSSININIGGEDENLIKGINAEAYIKNLTTTPDKLIIYMTEDQKIKVE